MVSYSETVQLFFTHGYVPVGNTCDATVCYYALPVSGLCIAGMHATHAGNAG